MYPAFLASFFTLEVVLNPLSETHGTLFFPLTVNMVFTSVYQDKAIV